jgi:phosphomannomutase
LQISFGSDGFRGVIGHTLTREAVARIVLGLLDMVRSQQPEIFHPVIPIGYDTRFLAAELAHYAARLLAAAGAKPVLVNRACPSPYLAFATKHLNAPVGIQFTASHNPPKYGGIKLKGSQGGSLVPSLVSLVEFFAVNCDPSRFAGEPFMAIGKLPGLELDRPYAKALVLAAKWLGDAHQPVVVDYMHGTATGIYRDLLGRYVNLTTELRAQPDPLFGGCKPEPVATNLTDLVHAVQYDGLPSFGLAFDGDGDRLGVVDETGQVLASHEIFCLLLEHIARREQVAGGIVVTSVSFSCLVERVARSLGLVVNEVPVGFKNITQAMIEDGAIIGGEESGGTGFGFHLPERDALLMALLLMAARQQAGTTLHEMVASLYERHGRPVFFSANLELPSVLDQLELKTRLRTLVDLATLAGDGVVSLNHKDGMKLKTNQGWVLLRPSGTEPLIRVYAEADSLEQARAYAVAALAHTGLPALPA